MTGNRTVDRTKIACPNCGAPVTLRTFENASRIVCEYCDSLIDNSNQGVSIVEQYHERAKIKPKIPFGSRGKFEGREFEVVGFMRRRGPGFQWYEYILFNPYYGFRYLVDSDRHWNFVKPMGSVPKRQRSSHPSILHKKLKFKQFSSYSARVTYVLGEFPWRVQADDTSFCTDYVCPPHVISEESTTNEEGAAEINYSLGLYMTAAEVFGAFNLKAPNSRPSTVAPNQPNPLEATWKELKVLAGYTALAFLAVVVIYVFRSGGHRALTADVQIIQSPAEISTNVEGQALEVDYYTSPEFQLSGGSRNVLIDFFAPVNNSWVFVAGNLINLESEEAYPFEAEISYYHGYEGGESWSEGSTSNSLIIGSVPPGRYKLVVATDYDKKSTSKLRGRSIKIRIDRDVWLFRYILLVFLILISFPCVQWLRYYNFETNRWADSDFGGDE